MSRRFKSILLLVVILLEVTFLAHFKFFSVIPNYMLVCVFAISFISADSESVVISSLAGLLTDLITGAPFGLNTLLCMYTSIIVAIISDSIYNKSVKLVCPVCFITSFVYELLFGLFSTLMRDVAFDFSTVTSIILPVALVNSIVFIPVYIVLSKVKSEKRRKGIKYEQ